MGILKKNTSAENGMEILDESDSEEQTKTENNSELTDREKEKKRKDSPKKKAAKDKDDGSPKNKSAFCDLCCS